MEAMDVAAVMVFEEPQEVAQESMNLDHCLVREGRQGNLDRR